MTAENIVLVKARFSDAKYLVVVKSRLSDTQKLVRSLYLTRLLFYLFIYLSIYECVLVTLETSFIFFRVIQ